MSKNDVTPEAIVSVEEGEIRYKRDDKKGVIEIDYREGEAGKYIPIGSFSVDADVIKEHNGRIKDTFKGTKNMFPAWVYRETLGRTHQDIRNAIESAVRKAEKAVEKEAEKAEKAKQKAAKAEAKKTKKETEAPPELEAEEADEVDELLEAAKAELNE